MKRISLYISFCIYILAHTACEKNDMLLPETYACTYDFVDSSATHPKAARYQSILDENRKRGMVGATLLVKDAHGLWMGSSGKADLASNIDVQSCNRFLIASISKSFTAAAVFRLIDQGLINLEDPVSQWIENDLISNVANADKATVRQLLDHTSGIPDYITLRYEMDQINERYNAWSLEDVLSYTHGVSATHEVGETYSYSNTNYLLLGIILEKATGQSLEEVYHQEVFGPLNLSSAYYSDENPLPTDVVRGYVDLYGNRQYVESEFLYKDELKTADGGIAIHAYDVWKFFDGLMNANLISAQSLNDMTDWSALPEDWVDDEYFGHFQNGLGLERSKTPYETALGHTGGIYGFFSLAQYFPESGYGIVLLVNTISDEYEGQVNTYRSVLAEMFE